MKFTSVPTINKDLFAFDLRFKGRDGVTGDRHFVEHMVFNDNEHYKGSDYRDELAKAGAGNFFGACTSISEIIFSGMYLKKDEERITELLNMMMADCVFTPEDTEKERKIILEEEAFGRDNMIHQAWITLSKELGFDFSVLGSVAEIKAIQPKHLRETYNNIICRANAELTFHNADLLVENIHVPHRSIVADIPQPVLPAGINGTNDEMSSSVCWMVFNEKVSIKSTILADYLNHTSGPLFANMRERDKLGYAVGASNCFYNYDMLPYLQMYCITTEHPDLIFEKFLENFKVEHQFVYDALIKQEETNYARAKSEPQVRISMQRYADRFGIGYDEIITAMPSFGELQSYAHEVKKKIMSTIAIVGTKPAKE